MSLVRRFAVLSFVAAAGLALPSAALAGHQHSRNCGHGGGNHYHGHDSGHGHYSSHGHGYSYYRPAPYHRHGYAAPYAYAAPYYGGAYYDSGYYDAYSYAPPPPPPRCYRRPRVGLFIGF